MRLLELFEGKNTPSIVVDIQPCYGEDHAQVYDYSESNTRIFQNVAKFLNKQKGPILMFVNANETEMTEDNVEHDIIPYWEEKLGFTNWDNVTINDKGYGYLRGWMDQGVSDATIIKAIRLMYQNKVTDSRELFGGAYSISSETGGTIPADDYEINMKAALGEWKDNMKDDAISVEWTSVAQLKKYSGAYIMGGGRDECLKEVQLLMSAFNIKYKVIEAFIYG